MCLGGREGMRRRRSKGDREATVNNMSMKKGKRREGGEKGGREGGRNPITLRGEDGDWVHRCRHDP